jgi:MFS family permease
VAYPSQAGPAPMVRSGALFLAYAALAGVLFAFPAAWVWAQVADPPAGELTKTGVILGEVQLNQQSEVTLWFLVVGAVAGFLAGLVVGWLGRRRGVVVVVAVLMLCAVAAVLSGYLGIHVFGPDEKAEAAAASVGDLVTSRLALGTDLAYLGWPIGGLAGACLALVCAPEYADDMVRNRRSRTMAARTPTTGNP